MIVLRLNSDTVKPHLVRFWSCPGLEHIETEARVEDGLLGEAGIHNVYNPINCKARLSDIS
jgi:hypothetical protein